MAKKLRDEDLVLNIIVNGDKGKKEINQLERAISDNRLAVSKLLKEQKLLEKQGKTESATYKANTIRIKEYSDANVVAENRLKQLRSGMKLTEMSLSDLQKEHRRLTTLLRTAIPGSENWHRYQAELKAVSARMTELNGKAKATGLSLGQMANGVNKYIGIATAGLASLMTVITGMNKAKKAFADYDEALVDAQKTTELTKDEVILLSERLARIDTRTAQNELLNLARVGGKLGIKGVQDVEAFSRAADKINVALSEDLGGNAEAAINQIGKLVDIFHLKEKYGIEDAMIRVGSAINEAGAASTANEGYIVNFSKRVAGIAPNADVSVQNVIGLAATLDQLGQTAETSATVYGQTVTKMYTKTADYARIAKMSLEEFRDLLNRDVNGAFIALLKGVRGNADGMNEIVNNIDDLSIRGARGAQVIGALVKNVDVLEKQQLLANEAFAEGTSAIEEFEKKNNSAQATLEKARKSIVAKAVALGKILMPAVRISTSGISYLIKALLSAITTFIQYKSIIILVTAATAAYILIKKAVVFWSIESRKAIISEYLAINKATIGTKLLSAAKLLLIGQFKAAALAAKAFFVSLGPIGWAITAITGLIGIVSALKNATSDAEKAQRRLNAAHQETTQSVETENAIIGVLFTRLKNATKGSDDYQKAKDAIISKYGVYLDGLDEEIRSLDNVKGAYDAISSAARHSIIERMKARQLEEAASSAGESWAGALSGLDQALQDSFKKGKEAIGQQLMPIIKEALTAENTSVLPDQEAARNRVMTALRNSGFNQTGPTIYNNISQYIDDYLKASELWKKEQADIERVFGESYNKATVSTPSADNPSEGGSRSDHDSGDDSKNKKNWSLANDKEFLEKSAALKNQYLAGEITTEQAYKELLLQLEIDSLTARIKLNRDSEAEILKMKDQVVDKWIEKKKLQTTAEEKLQKLIADTQEDLIAKEKSAFDQRLKDHELFGIDKANLSATQAQALEGLQKQHQKNLDKIENDAIEKALKKRQDEFNRETTVAETRHNEELAAITTLEQAKTWLYIQYGLEDTARYKSLADAKKRIQEEQNKEIEQATKAHLEELTDLLRKMLTDGTLESIDLSNSLLSEEQKEALMKRLEEIGLKISEINANKGTSDADKDKEQEYSFSKGKTDILGLTPDDWALFFQNLGDAKIGLEELTAVAMAMSSAYQMYNNFVTASENRQLKEFKKSNDQKKNNLKERLDQGKISQELYNKRIAELDQEQDQKQDDIEKKQARRQKLQGIIDSLINTAIAVTAALRYGPGYAAVIGGLGIAQTAIISATGREDGGFFVEREQDAKKFNAKYSPGKRGRVDNPTILVGENGSEYVIPADGMLNPTLSPLIDTIEAARMQGSLRDIDFASILAPTIPGRASGGFASRDFGQDSGSWQQPMNGGFDPDLLNRILTVLSLLNDRLKGPIPAIVSMFGKNGLEEIQDELKRIREKGNVG